jgi:nucleotide-binding universal stress UspA family protein
MYEKILVPVDGSVTSNQGLNEAIKIAKSQGSQLRLVHVVNEFIIGDVYGTGFYASSIIDVLRDSGRTILDDAKDLARQHGVTCDAVFLESLGGTAAKFILEQASQWPADLIVMGTHGRRGIVRMTLGSDAEHVLRAAMVPVLLVRSLPEHNVASKKAKPADARAA